ncbi:MAG: hypothetical protein GYB65_08230 [Chloroflexi bacterium]|nr:hypothetical protein [Chloroflexota bacterium]
MTKHIVPRYKLVLCYDPKPGQLETYYNFVMNELVPAVQEMELYMFEVYHTLWGDFPHRQAEFVAEDLAIIHTALESDTWQTLEQTLMQYVTKYRRKIIPFRRGFQL